jgi:outer membrane autotransporter protein
VTVPAGTVIPAGTIFIIVNNHNTGTTGQTVTVVTAAGTNPLYTFTAIPVSTGSIQITLTGSPETVPIVNPPADPLVPVAAGVATALQNTPQTPDIINVRAAINALTDPIAVVHAEAQLAPSTPALTAPLVTFQGQRQFQTLWLSRLDMCQPSTLYKQDSNVQSGVSSGDEMQGTGDGVWVKGFGYLSHQDARSTFVEYNMRTYGLMAAYDKPLGLNTRAGLGLGYAWSRIKSTDANTEFNTYDAVAYIGHDIGPWFVHGSATFGWNEYSDSRHINFPGVDRTAEADHSGQDYTAFMNTGYRIPIQKFNITPVASLQYTYSRMEGYTEGGAGDLNLKVDSKDYNFVQSGLGFKVEREFSYRGKSLIPELHFRWLHMLNNPKLQTTSAFSPEGSPKFTTSGLKTSRETYNAGCGLTFFTRICRPVTWSLEGVYDYDWRTDGFYSHMATGRVTLRY